MPESVNATAAALLGLLQEGPATGYVLARRAAEELGNFWTVTRSQVYRELSSMAGAGLVEVQATGSREQRPYRITDGGRAAFAAWLHSEPGPDTVRIPLLLRLAFVDQLDPARLTAMVAGQRVVHEERLALYRELEQSLVAAGVDGRQLLTLRFGLRYEQAVLEWFDELAGHTDR